MPAAPLRSRRGSITTAVIATLTAGLGLNACGGGGTEGADQLTVRVGYLPNLTHAPALIAVHDGLLARRLGPHLALRQQSFNAGPDCMTALLAGSIDACFSGPGPAINAFVSGGRAIRIVAGATSGGAGLVVRSSAPIGGPADLRGRTLATPQLGNTQDVALRTYLHAHGLTTDPQGGGDVRIVPTANASILQLFAQGAIDGAWVPEPYLTRLLLEDHGRLLVDEASLWPDGRFATTDLVTSTALLSHHPERVRALIEADLDAIAASGAHPDAARAAVNDELAALTQRPLPASILASAWGRLHLSPDPLAASLSRSAQDARAAGLLRADADVHGICDLTVLNSVLRERAQPPVSAAGLGPS